MFTASVDLSAFHRARDLTIERVGFGVRDAAQNAAEAGAAEAKRAGQFKDKTGILRSNIMAVYLRSSQRSSQWAIFSPTPYSVFVENPTKAHEIWPKAGYNLKGPVRAGQGRRARGTGSARHALAWNDGSGMHFARMVHHPGTRGFPFMGPAYLKAEAVLRSSLETTISGLQRYWV